MRVKIKLPEQAVYETTISVRVDDLNYSGHMGNDAVLRHSHEARIRFLAQLGVTELEIGAKDQGLVMVDTAIEFKSEAFQSEEITIAVYVGAVSPISFDLYFKLSGEDGRLVAKVKSGHVAFDYSSRKLSKFPEFFLEKLGYSKG